MAKTRTGVSLSSVGDALKRALTLLSRRAYTEWELREKLRVHEASEVESALMRLKDWGYLDDRALAEAFVRSHRARWGPHKLRRRLRERGVDAAIIASVVGDEEDVEAAWRLLQSRRQRMLGHRARAIRFLQGRGFSLHTAIEAYDRLQSEEGEE